MSIDMYVSSSKSQASSTSTMCKIHVQGYEQLQRAISDFTLNSPMLSSKAYDSAKAYYSAVLLPLAKGGTLLSEAVEEAVKKFPEEYTAQVDSVDLKESELEEKIRQLESKIAQAEAFGRSLRSTKNAGMLKATNSMIIGVYQKMKHELEEKLQKLRAFNASSPSIFSEISSLQAAVSQGIAQTKTSWNASTGTFTVPNSKDLAWASQVNKNWTKRQEQIEEKRRQEYLDSIEYMFDPDDGKLIGVFVKGEYDADLTKELQGAIQKQDMDFLMKFGSGFIDQLSKNNGQWVLDWLLGERSINPDAIDTSSYQTGRFAADLFSMIQGGAEFLGGGLWLFGGNTAAIAGAIQSGGASLGAIPAVNASGLAISGHGLGTVVSAWNSFGDGYSGVNNKVNNMNELFETDFGGELKNNISKTKKRVDGQTVYRVDKKTGNLKKGDQLYLDGLHKDHIEVFDRNGNFRTVLNLDGTINIDKMAKAAGRVLK